MQHIPCNSWSHSIVNLLLDFSIIRKHHDTHISSKLYTLRTQIRCQNTEEEERKKKKKKRGGGEEEEEKTKSCK